MRLIDADAFLKRNEEYADCEFIHPKYQNTLREIVDDEPTIPASPWHRVEEPPKEVGCYLVVGFDRHWFYDIAEYFPIDNEWAMNENQSDSTYIRYWMPLPEPPGEDA